MNQQLSLETLAVQINEQHSQATNHARTAIEHARHAGELLIEAKASVPHGQWLEWLRKNCSVSGRQAQRYMKVAANWERISKCDAASFLTIDQSIRHAPAADQDQVYRTDKLFAEAQQFADELDSKIDSAETIDELSLLLELAERTSLSIAATRIDIESGAGRYLNSLTPAERRFVLTAIDQDTGYTKADWERVRRANR
ncbi:DUF3102 domain-containing protein [Stieleria sp. TO1_6]|uniref:DUF3102 domain-containing protein n=1 Tax=Stieleria tagensis TaxID=2956795 RepID=UPI00209A893F|nr:DUF3102 domain-containing protein [Stieleria tagensis]MCO8124496.1 DUF3102 domain-containing protein [Stieleria tagensis]